jgi:aspartyl-tRNA(Asn)/glutamyl-tRNA(Gln) amidotransferase subunit A
MSMFLSATELSQSFASGERSPVEVVQQHLARIAQLDPKLKSYLAVTAEQALEAAREAESEIREQGLRGPLHGVPIALKDIFDTAGLRTTSGSKILCDHVPTRDAAVVERLRAAGMILLGKLNMHEFAFGTTNDNAHYGACHNPWNLERVPGGSSGGSGAALAAGLTPLSLGTDTGGSIRIPASVCGVVGLKPTFGRVSRRGVLPLSWTLDHVGPLTRTVEDAALLYEVIAGPDREDAWSANRPVEVVTRDLRRGVKGLRVGVPREFFFESLEPDVARAIEDAIAWFQRAGAGIVEVTVPHIGHAYTALHAILASEAGAFHLPWLRSRLDEYGEETRLNLLLGQFIPAADVVDARRMQAIVGEEFAEAMREADLLLTPSLPRTAPVIGQPVSREPHLAWNRFVAMFNLTGMPAISVPCGFDRDGLPMGLQLAGRPFDEATVLRAAFAYERGTPWHERRPPGFE